MRKMRILVLVVAVAGLTLVPVTGAAGDECSDIVGTARYDFGRTLTGTAKLVIDGEKIKVDFVGTGFEPTGEFTADVFFDWFFPHGTVSIVEHSTAAPITGPLVGFDSTIAVLAGATGSWTWSGVSNVAAGLARITSLEGTICFAP